jgi:hypothetical protein
MSTVQESVAVTSADDVLVVEHQRTFDDGHVMADTLVIAPTSARWLADHIRSRRQAPIVSVDAFQIARRFRLTDHRGERRANLRAPTHPRRNALRYPRMDSERPSLRWNRGTGFKHPVRVLLIATAIFAFAFARPARAQVQADPRTCVRMAEEGQRARNAGRLRDARERFRACVAISARRS